MKKIGLALSGGGVRAYAHLGLLSNLSLARIPVHVVSGASAGAIIGACFCADISLDLLKNRLKKYSLFSYIKPVFPFYGLSSYKKVTKKFSELGIPERFEELKKPLIVVASDLNSRSPVYFNSGSLWDALLASMALPPLFPPVKMGDMYLVDGGITKNLPVSVLKANNVDFVIASDVNSSSRKYPNPSNVVQVTYESVTLMVQIATEEERRHADFIIDTDLKEIGFLDFEKREEVINYSYKSSYNKILELKKILEGKGYVQSGGMGSLFVSPLS